MSSEIALKPIRCLLESKVKGNKIVNEYMLKSGKHITEVITDLGQGNKGVREIYKYSNDPKDIEKVVDTVFGRLEVFYPGKVGVIQEVEGVKCPLPNVTIDALVRATK